MNSRFQHKLSNYEVPPREEVWNKIAASLEENVSFTLSEKLYNYQEQPSTNVWQNIYSELNSDTHENSKVVPFYTRYRRPLKYSAAIAIFIFVAALASLLITKKTESELPAQTVATKIPKTDTAKSPSQEKSTSTDISTEKNEANRVITKSKITRTQKEQYGSSGSINEKFLPREAKRNETASSSLFPDKYMIYSDDDGNAIRLPKKIFSAYACPTDDFICKRRLQQLREKFAESAMTTDFTGLLQILKSLQENQ